MKIYQGVYTNEAGTQLFLYNGTRAYRAKFKKVLNLKYIGRL